jgi:hypothetical protein
MSPPVFYPTTVRDEAITDEHWLAWSPRHLLDRPIFIEPFTGRHWLALTDLNWRESSIDTACGPHFS